MKSSKCLFITVLMLLLSATVKAQFDAHFSQFWNAKGYYNPAWAGQTDLLTITGAYNMELLGFTNAPKSMYLAADMPISFMEKKHGVGLSLFSEGIGLFRDQLMSLQYSYKTTIKKGKLGIGIQAGSLKVSFDPTNINLGEDTDDEAFPTNKESGSALDLAAGVVYTHAKYYLAFSGQHLTAPKISLGERSEIEISPVIYLTGGYNIPTRNPLITIQPSAQLRTDFTTTRLDLAGRLFYTHNEKIFNGGVIYTPDTSVAVCLGATIRGVTVGYVYEYYTSKISIANGGHELLISYATEINLFKKQKNKHKSIRIL
ncbi:type IX secretion system membrane protein PorP/SprF [Bacteroides sp. 214]|nr:PorP/SprF family type IX secretion system membrane protein [Bacteroides sp. 214]NDW13046.1 type IX secretion system membrane protein PorP/SprF [Bacteroides sp. 214]